MKERGGREEEAIMRKLYRSRDDRWIAGVCGGVAEYLGVSSALIRILVVLSGVGILGYLIAAIVIPEE